MTEAEWLECKDAREMILSDHLAYSARKLRLFAVACCRCSRQLLLNPDHRRDVDLAERFADGLATEGELTDAYERVNALACRLNVREMSEREIRRWAEATAVANAVRPLGDPASDTVWQIRRAGHRAVDGKMVALLHDIFGNPFRPIERAPGWLASVPAEFRATADRFPGVFNRAWLTATVVALAHAAYEDRSLPRGELNSQRLAVLSDALEEAGCGDTSILDHLRLPGPHVRGCWAVDLCLGLT